jgi:hypothetical protein
MKITPHWINNLKIESIPVHTNMSGVLLLMECMIWVCRMSVTITGFIHLVVHVTTKEEVQRGDGRWSWMPWDWPVLSNPMSWKVWFRNSHTAILLCCGALFCWKIKAVVPVLPVSETLWACRDRLVHFQFFFMKKNGPVIWSCINPHFNIWAVTNVLNNCTWILRPLNLHVVTVCSTITLLIALCTRKTKTKNLNVQNAANCIILSSAV